MKKSRSFVLMKRAALVMVGAVVLPGCGLALVLVFTFLLRSFGPTWSDIPMRDAAAARSCAERWNSTSPEHTQAQAARDFGYVDMAQLKVRAGRIKTKCWIAIAYGTRGYNHHPSIDHFEYDGSRYTRYGTDGISRHDLAQLKTNAVIDKLAQITLTGTVTGVSSPASPSILAEYHKCLKEYGPSHCAAPPGPHDLALHPPPTANEPTPKK